MLTHVYGNQKKCSCTFSVVDNQSCCIFYFQEFQRVVPPIPLFDQLGKTSWVALSVIFLKVFFMKVDGALDFALLSKTCKLSYCGFLPSTMACWKLLMWHYNLNAQVVSCTFSCRTMKNFVVITIYNRNNRLDHVSKIMSKSQDVFTENFPIFFSNSVSESNLRTFRRPSFGDYLYVTFVS